MKKLLFILAAVTCLLSCRSVKNECITKTHHNSINADTLAAIAKSATVDSTRYYHGVIDSLCSQLRDVRQKYRELYVKDSINTYQYRADSVSVRDTTWMEVNNDGSVTYHNYREKNTFSYQQVESIKQHIINENRASVDSLIEINQRQQVVIDSISQYRSYVDSVAIYRSKLDSMSNVVNDMQKTIIEQYSLWDRIKTILGSIFFFIAPVFAGVVLYLRYRRK